VLTEQAAFGGHQDECLALLRTRGLSIKGLDDKKREELRAFLDHLHNGKGMSLNDIAKLVGSKTSGYTSWVCRELGVKRRPFEEARLKGIREKRRKYERKPFDGTDEDRAYLLGLRHGDLSVSRPWRGVVRVSTSTTHTAMAQLFHGLFESYGHVYQEPRFKKVTRAYEWNLAVILDQSFDFLFQDKGDVWNWVVTEESTMLAYLAGILDAEGSVGIYSNGSGTALQVLVYNTNLDLVRFVKSAWENLGYDPLGPYLDKEEGTITSKYQIARRKDYWKVVLARFGQAQSLLRRLALRHEEKVSRKNIALALFLGDKWVHVEPTISALRDSIRTARDSFVEEAERRFLEEHHSAVKAR
jgi:LAGLIDADG-like domain